MQAFFPALSFMKEEAAGKNPQPPKVEKRRVAV